MPTAHGKRFIYQVPVNPGGKQWIETQMAQSGTSAAAVIRAALAVAAKHEKEVALRLAEEF